MKKNIIKIIFVLNIIYAFDITIDASDWDVDNWTYLNLYIGAIVYPTYPDDNLGWDLAFHRYHIRTNSGLSGSGNGGAYIDSVNIWNDAAYESFDTVPDDSFFHRDTTVGSFYDIETHESLPGIANPALEKWGNIDLDNEYEMQYTNYRFIVRSAAGNKFYKLWITNYYDQNGTSGFVSIKYEEIASCSLGHDECGECGGDGTSCKGCMDATACNYDQMASINDLESCDGDTDQDGVCNQDDICPNNWDPYQNDQDGDGLADACDDDDDDGDGLVDCWSFWYDPDDGDIDGDNIADNFGINCDDAALGINDLALLNDYSLSQNYPNPFNPSTSIEYAISHPSDISVDIFDIKGRKIITLDRGFRNIGSYIIYWDGMNEQSQKMPSGLYVYRLMANGIEIEKKKMLLLF